MALFKSHLVTQASGSIGGTTFTRAGSGLVMRARAIPVQTNTPQAASTKNALTTAILEWTERLTAEQRAAWEVYASNVPTTNALGDVGARTGQNMWVRARSLEVQRVTRLLSNVVLTGAAPTIFDRSTFTPPDFASFDATNGIFFDLVGGDAWAVDPENYMLLFQHRPANVSRNHTPQASRLIALAQGADPIAPSEITEDATAMATLGFGARAGTTCRFSFLVLRSDGRVSSSITLGPFTALA